MSEKDIERYRNLELPESKAKELDFEKEYPEIAMQVGKFVRDVGRGMWECSIHHMRVSPLVKIAIYTSDGQMVAAQSFASACFGDAVPSNVKKAVIKEVGSYCVAYAVTETLILVCLSSNPGFWVALAIGLAGAYAGFKYSKFIDVIWKMSSRHDMGIDPIYATPNIEGNEFLESYRWEFRKVRTKRTGSSLLGDAEPVDLFFGRPATRENYVGITTNDFGSKWLIRLK